MQLIIQAAVRAGHLRANPLDGLGRFKRNGDENVDPFNAPLLYVQKAGGWRSASVLLRVYARWVPEGIEPAASAHPAAPQGHPAALVSG